MQKAEEYAKWLVDNQNLKGTPEFKVIAQAYQESRPAAPVESGELDSTGAGGAMMGLGVSSRLTSPNAIRYGAPIAAGFLTSGASLPLTAATLTGASTVGELGASIREGDVNLGRAAKAGIVGGVGSFVPGSRAVGDGAIRSGLRKLGGYIKSGGANATAQGAGAIAGDLAEDVIEGNGPKGALERASNAIIPAITGMGFGIASRYGNEIGKTAADRRVAVELFGKSELPPEAIDPAFARAGAAKTNRTGKSGMDSIEEDLAARYSAIAGNPPEGATLSQQLAPYVGTLDDANTSLGKARQQADIANIRFKDAKDAYEAAITDASARVDGRLSGALDAFNKASDEQMAANLGAIRQEAFRLKQAKIGEAYVDFPALRNFYVEKIQKPLEAVVERKADALYKQIGISPTEPLVDGSVIASMIGASSKAGVAGEDELAFITNRVLSRISSGKDEAGDIIYKQLSLNDARALRRELWDLRDNVPSGTTRSDSLLSDVDGAISKALEGSIAGKAGESGLNAYRDANAYWRGISQARQNPLARALMSRSPTDESVQTLIAKMVEKGPKVDEKLGVDEYIRSVAGGEPAIMEEMKGQMMSIIRGGLVAKNLDADVVNIGKLADDMARLKRNGFPVNSLNLGGVEEMKQIAALSNKAGLGSRMSQEQLLEIIESPGVQDAIMAGRNFSVAAAKPIAALAAVDQIKLARAAEVAGLTGMAAEKYSKASANLRASGMAADEVAKRVKALDGDPLMVAFSGGKNFGLNGKAQDDFDRFLSSVINTGSTTSGEVRQLMGAIEKKSPELREYIAQRVIKDKLKWAVENKRTGKQNLDYQSATESIQDTERANRLRALLGNETYTKLNAIMPQVEALRKIERARLGSGPSETIGQYATAGRAAAEGSPTATVGYFAKSMSNFISNGHYALASFFISQPRVWSVVERTGDVAKAIESLGVQRAYLLYQNDHDLREEVRQVSGR